MFQHWLAPPVFANEVKTYLAALLNATLLTVIGMWLSGILLQILLGSLSAWTEVLVSLGSIFGLLLIREVLRRGHVQIVSVLVPILGFAIISLQAYHMGAIDAIHVAGYLLVIALATLLVSIRAGLLYTVLTCLFTWILANLEMRGLVAPAEPLAPNYEAFIFIIVTIFSFGVVTTMRTVMMNSLYKALQEIGQRQRTEQAMIQLNHSLDRRVSERTLELEEVIEKQFQTEMALRARNEAFSILHSNTLAFLRYRDIDELLQSLVDHATQLLDAPFGEIVTLHGDELVVRAYSSNQPYLTGDRSKRGQAVLAWQAVDTLEPAMVEDYSSWPMRRTLFDGARLHAAMELPITVGDGPKCLGVLGLARTRLNQPFTSDEIEMGRLFTQIAGLAIENIQLQSTLLEQSLRDPLTGLHNRRYLFETLQHEFARARRSAYPLSFVLLDIDHFKSLNDLFGHGAGDAMLRGLAEKLKSQVRAGDILCRYGGDEHMIVLYNASGSAALARTEQLRLAVENMVVNFEDQALRCTLSIGVASFPEHGSSIDEVISSADRALYQSKNTGRNRSTLFQNVWSR
jgi:diguanylate cyclase (GGDEF)-like protein